MLTVDFYLLECKDKPALPEGYLWIPETNLDQYGKPRLFELLIKALNA